MLRLVAFTVAIMFALGLTACNTVQGVGEDITGLGKWGQETINDQ